MKLANRITARRSKILPGVLQTSEMYYPINLKVYLITERSILVLSFERSLDSRITDFVFILLKQTTNRIVAEQNCIQNLKLESQILEISFSIIDLTK